jgi:hypothetical protein
LPDDENDPDYLHWPSPLSAGAAASGRSRKGIGDFPLSERTNGYWDRSDTQMDLVGLGYPPGFLQGQSCTKSEAFGP